MPIYEFYCSRCHMIFNFFSTTINTEKRPNCPRCRKTRLVRQMSAFASPRVSPRKTVWRCPMWTNPK